MDKLIEKIIEKTELKNWTLFLFIFAISFTKGLQIITGHWFHIPDADDKFNNTTLFLLEVFLSSLTITRFLVAIKFLEALSRTPIIADIINFVVVERRKVIVYYNYSAALSAASMDEKAIEPFEDFIPGLSLKWGIKCNVGVTQKLAWGFIHYNIIVEDNYPYYNILKDAVSGQTYEECTEGLILEPCILTPSLELYRYFDKKKYGFWILKRQFCLEHFLTVGIILGAAYVAGIVIRLFL
jgi:hypothetical protein